MTSKTEPKPDNADVIYAFFNEIGIIGQLSSTVFRRTLPDGMTMAQFGVLNHFVRLGGERTPAQLAASFQVTKGAMTNTLQRLDAKGHITIATDTADRRRKIVTITEDGRTVRNQAIAALASPLKQLAGAFDVDEIEAALPFLRQVRAYLDEARNAEDFPAS